MSAELDRELVGVAREAYERAQTALHGPSPMEAALTAALEGLKAQPDRGQGYAYRVCWDAGREGTMRTRVMSLARAEQFKDELGGSPWVERALLGTWERVEQ